MSNTFYDDIDAAEPEWAWWPFILEGEVSMIVAKRKEGKGHLCADIAARITRGWPMPPFDPLDPSQEHTSPRQVIMITPEDHPAETTKPRLVASGADTRRILDLSRPRKTTMSGGTIRNRFSLPTDIPTLRAAIKKMNDRAGEQDPDGVPYGPVGMVIIDPLMATATKTIAFNMQARLHMIEPLQELAYDTGVAILLTHHFNKFVTFDNMEDKINGSGGLLDALRVTNVIVRDPMDDEVRVLVSLLNNLERDGSQVPYRIVGKSPYSHVQYKVPPPDPGSMSEDRLTAYVLSMLIDAERPVSSQELATYLRLSHAIVQQVLRQQAKAGTIHKIKGNYIMAAIGAKPKEVDDTQPMEVVSDSQPLAPHGQPD